MTKRKSIASKGMVWVLLLLCVGWFSALTACKSGGDDPQASGDKTKKAPGATGGVQKADLKFTGALSAEDLANLKEAGFEQYNLKLPKPMFVGTPENLKTPNLEKVTGKKRAMPIWPMGLKNVALEKDVTASDDEPVIGELEMLTDADQEAADGHYMELGPGLQWVQFDLGRQHEIFGIIIWHYHAQARVFFDVVVKGADDADFITGVQTLFNNDHDNSAGLGVGEQKEYIESNEGKLIETFDGDKADAKGVKTRYLRFYSNGNSSNEMNHYIEVEVWARPAK